MKRFIFIVILTATTFSQGRFTVNPGLKLGIYFGEKIQFVFGTEWSIVYYDYKNDNSRYGIVLDYDKGGGIEKLHIGVEYMYRAAGIDVGPAFVWKDDEIYYGYSIIPFGVALLIPYVNYTYLRNMEDQYEAGTYLKISNSVI